MKSVEEGLNKQGSMLPCITVELTNDLKEFCPENMTLAEMLLRWILDHDEVSTIIPGASSPKHIAQNAKFSDLPALSKELMQTLEDFYNKKIHSHIRGKY